MKYIKYLLFALLLIIPFNVNALEFHFEESENLSSSGVYISCYQEDNKLFCTYNPNVSSGYSKIHEIDLDTLSIKSVKNLNTYNNYINMVKVNDKFIAGAVNLRDTITSVVILDSNYNVIKEEIITDEVANLIFKVMNINGDYYVVSETINAYKNGVALKVSSDLETFEYVTLDDLNGDEFNFIRSFDEIHNVLNPVGSNLDNIIAVISEYDGGYSFANGEMDSVVTPLNYYKDHELKWTINNNGSFGPSINKKDSFLIFREDIDEVKTYIDEYSKSGNLIKNYPIESINNQGRLFLSNDFMGKYNNNYYLFTYNPVTINNYTSWSNWRLAVMSIVGKITNKDKNVIIVDDNASPGDEVTINVDKNKEKLIDKIIVKDENGNEIPVINYKFIMPNSDITIEVLYKNANNPNTGRNIGIFIIVLSILIGNLVVFVKKKKKPKKI